MSTATSDNAAQVEYWNAQVGDTWVALQALLDRQLEPLGRAAVRALAAAPGERLLDIGCGCGQTSMELAAEVGPQGSVTGIDISRPMLEVGRRREPVAGGAPVTFLERDAQADDLGPAAFDAAFSRFGVMFFADPVAAFTNIGRAIRPGGRLAFVCWRSLPENPWMREPFEAVASLLPPPPPADPLAPGPMAFADPARVRAILTRAGFSGIGIEPFDARIGAGDVEQCLTAALRVGPLGAALREHPELAGQVIASVREVLTRYLEPDGMVRMPAGVWIVSARR